MKENYVNWVVKESEHKIKLKEKDIELVGLMNVNARIQLGELSKKMKLSKVAVFNRIRNLEEKGIITGYSCFVD
ncbi:MAG: winged helix-turn-helix transcriptional regulator, partial [archaeon]